MFPLVLSLFDTGLLITVVIFLLLYLIVLLKLKPSTEKTPKKKSLRQNIRKFFSTERQNEPVVSYKAQEEPAEKVEAVERPKPVSTVPVETERTEFSEGPRPPGCPHHFGYLRKHPKNTPIPNECFTCTKIMECLLREE